MSATPLEASGQDPTGRFEHPHLPTDVVTLRHPSTGVVWLLTPEAAREWGYFLILQAHGP